MADLYKTMKRLIDGLPVSRQEFSELVFALDRDNPNAAYEEIRYLSGSIIVVLDDHVRLIEPDLDKLGLVIEAELIKKM